MKYVLGAVLLSLSTFCGYVLSFRYRERLNFYSDFYGFNERLKTAVSFTLQTLGSLVKDAGNPDLSFVLHLARQKGVEVRTYDTMNYECVTLLR